MYLDERSLILLKEIIAQPVVDVKYLSEKFNITKNQIDYSIHKINSWLEEKNFELIRRSKTGAIIVDDNIRKAYSNNLLIKNYKYIPKEDERVFFMLLMLVSKKNNLSINSFIEALRISKNTVLRDLKESAVLTKDYNVAIKYSRDKGYELVGEEWDIRKLLVFIISKLFNAYNGELLLQKYSNITQQQLFEIKNSIETVEDVLKIKYSDNRLWVSCYVLAIVLLRIKQGYTIDNYDYGIDASSLADTKEYQVLSQLSFDIKTLSSNEKIYITIHLLSMNVQNTDRFKKTDSSSLELLEQAIDEFLEIFQKKAAILLYDLAELKTKLYLHLKPAFYRIKYNLTMADTSVNGFYDEFEPLYFLIKNSITPIEKLVGTTFPKQEILFITMFVGGYLLRTPHKKSVKYIAKATIISTNGMIVSKILENQLKEMFPMINFMNVTSMRKFENIAEKINVDMIFSTVPFKTNYPLIIVDNNIDESQKNNIKNRVYEIIYNGGNVEVGNSKIDKILKIVTNYVDIDEIILENIKKELLLLDTPNVLTETNLNLSSFNLSDLITPELIQIADELSWQEALKVSSDMLLDAHYIEQTYVDELFKLYPNMQEKIIIGKHTAIPHAAPECGANKTGMSFLKINKGIVDGKFSVYFMAVVAPADKNTHINAVYQLLKISSHPDIMNKLRIAKTAEEIHEIFIKYQNIQREGD